MSASQNLMLLFAAGVLSIPASPSGGAPFVIEPEESRVRFEVGHLDYAKPVRGRFERISGHIEYERAEPEELSGRIEIEVESIGTDNAYRDGHLRASFFETEQFPDIHFELLRFDRDENVVFGRLTMKGVSVEQRLEIENLRELEGRDGLRVLRCRASGVVNRRLFGVEEDPELNGGLGSLVGYIQQGLDGFIDDEVRVRISIVARETPLPATPDGYAGVE